MIAGALLMIVGSQVIALGLAARAYGVYVLGERDPWFERLRPRLQLEHGLLAGAIVMLVGLVLSVLDRREVGRGRVRRARRSEARDSRRHARDRRHPDLLHLVPALHPRPAPELLTVSTERASAAGDEVAALIARLRAEARASGLPDQAAGLGSGLLRRCAHGGRPRSSGRSASDRALPFQARAAGDGLRGVLAHPVQVRPQEADAVVRGARVQRPADVQRCRPASRRRAHAQSSCRDRATGRARHPPGGTPSRPIPSSR